MTTGYDTEHYAATSDYRESTAAPNNLAASPNHQAPSIGPHMVVPPTFVLRGFSRVSQQADLIPESFRASGGICCRRSPKFEEVTLKSFA